MVMEEALDNAYLLRAHWCMAQSWWHHCRHRCAGFAGTSIVGLSGIEEPCPLDIAVIIDALGWAVTVPTKTGCWPPTADSAYCRRSRRQRTADSVVASGTARLVLMDIYAHLHEKDHAYFRETRENRFGMKLEAVPADRDTRVVAFRQSLEPMRVMLGAQPFFRWRYTKLRRLHRLRLFPMVALHQRFPVAPTGRPRRCVAQSITRGIQWSCSGRAWATQCDNFGGSL